MTDKKMIDEVGKKEQKKLSLKKTGILGYFGLFGMVGFTIAVPVVLGAFAGKYLDDHFSKNISWSLSFILGGLVIGCYNAWRYIKKEYRE